jgi:hypothetical protein
MVYTLQIEFPGAQDIRIYKLSSWKIEEPQNYNSVHLLEAFEDNLSSLHFMSMKKGRKQF